MFVNPYPSKELADQLNRLICDRDSRQQWADPTYTWSLEFTRDLMAADDLALYQVFMGLFANGKGRYL